MFNVIYPDEDSCTESKYRCVRNTIVCLHLCNKPLQRTVTKHRKKPLQSLHVGMHFLKNTKSMHVLKACQNFERQYARAVKTKYRYLAISEDEPTSVPACRNQFIAFV